MLFLEEIWSRNFTNLFVAPLKVSEIITALTATALLRTLIGIIPAIFLATPFFGVSIFVLGPSLILLFLSLYLFGITLGLLVTSGLLRYGPAFENIAWSSLFLLAPLGCVYYPLSILPDWLQVVAKILPLVYIFEEVRSILLDNVVNYSNILTALKLNLIYFASAVSIFYLSFYGARKKGTLINVGE
jgi:ABC-2 type transport system permease protein